MGFAHAHGPNERWPLPKLGELDSFQAFMRTGWKMPERVAPIVPGAALAASAHRQRLSDALPGATLVIASGSAPVRVNDNYYDFRPDSDFFWLTGCNAESAVVVFAPVAGGHDVTVYLPEPARPGDPRFHTDHIHGELWVGAVPGPTEWARDLGVDVQPLTALETALDRLGSAARFGGTLRTEPALASKPTDTELMRTLSNLRMIKDEWEIGELRRAVDDTLDGFAATVAEFGTAMNGGGERWLQGTFDRHSRTVGNGQGYNTIVGSGAHAPTLHWVKCDGPVNDGELILLDMGVEANSYYTADVTRTFPTNGRFTESQRMVHDLVEKSHRAGIAAVQAGKPWVDFHHASMEVIAEGLHDWGILPVSVDEALSPTGQHHRRYLVCGVGHHLGLDVHDCAHSGPEEYHGATLEPGMVLTVEPGLYFHAFDTTVPPELRGVGVRLEDDLLVTATGTENLSAGIPLDATGIEAWMSGVQR